MDSWLLPLFTAISSWLSFRIISYFLFHPVTPITIGKFKIRGLIPQRMSLWSFQLADTITNTLVTDKRIVRYLSDPSTLQPMMPFIETHIDDFLRNKLGKAMPVVSMFVGDRTINQMKSIFMTELESLLPAVIHRFADQSLQPEKLRPVIQHEIDQLHQHVSFVEFKKKLKGQLLQTALIAGVIGFFCGLLLIGIIYLVNIF